VRESEKGRDRDRDRDTQRERERERERASLPQLVCAQPNAACHDTQQRGIIEEGSHYFLYFLLSFVSLGRVCIPKHNKTKKIKNKQTKSKKLKQKQNQTKTHHIPRANPCQPSSL
jgi:hypothetical protein